MEEKIEYTDTINYVVTTQPDIVAGYIDELNERIAEIEQELAELKEKAILPKFNVGQEVWHFITGKPIKDIIVRNDLFQYELSALKFGMYEDYLFATEQEAQEKLKEIQGNE